MIIELPYPPTINTYYRRASIKGRNWLNPRQVIHISNEGMAYRTNVIKLCFLMGCSQGNPRFTGQVSLHVDIFPPDRRKRDIDNLFKPLLDALQHGGVFKDDAQVTELSGRKHARIIGGAVRVIITSRETPATPPHCG